MIIFFQQDEKDARLRYRARPDSPMIRVGGFATVNGCIIAKGTVAHLNKIMDTQIVPDAEDLQIIAAAEMLSQFRVVLMAERIDVACCTGIAKGGAIIFVNSVRGITFYVNPEEKTIIINDTQSNYRWIIVESKVRS